MRRTCIIVAFITLFGVLAVPVSAADGAWHLRMFAAGFDPDFDVTVPAENPEMVRVAADSDLGWGAALEYQFSDRFGIELGYMQASPEIELSGDIPGHGRISLTDSMSTRVITVDVDVHLTPASQWFDVFVGGGIASVGYGNLHFVGPEGDPLDLAIDDDLTYSAKAGLDIALGRTSGWSATGGVRYVWSEIEVTEEGDPTGSSETFDFDLFHFTVGVAYSF